MPFGTIDIEPQTKSDIMTSSTNVRLIARLDVKGPNLIKGVHLEGLRKLGDPQMFAQRYYEAGIDELIYMDVVASLYGRNNLTDVVRHTAENVFIPITVGGGIRSVEDARTMLRSGADKIAINTAAIGNPNLIDTLAASFGAQCVVLSVEAIRQPDGRWEAHTDNGREKTGCDVVEWVQEAASRGAGEILLTSVDREGTQSGCDLDLARAVTDVVDIPVILSGGVGSPEHFVEAVSDGGADAVAVAHVLHYDKFTVPDIRRASIENGLRVRPA
jgi:imidazole glycerol-phosphate synthase subunit HisF